MRPPSGSYSTHLLPGPQVSCPKKELGTLGQASLACRHVEALRRQQLGFSLAVYAVCPCFNGCQLL